jgi:hypothetical protein
MHLIGTSGHNFIIETSTYLVDWNQVGVETPASDGALFVRRKLPCHKEE